MLTFTKPTFDELSAREWLVTNGLGGYASSSLSGANTRRYHGLLVAALNPPASRTVMVSKIEESLVFQRGSMVSLSANRYPGAIHPAGFQHLEGFERLPLPAFHYEVDGCRLVKRVFMPYGSNTVVVEYENSGGCAYSLLLNPLFVHRDYHSLFSENEYFNYWADWKSPDSAAIYAHYGAPALYFSFSKGTFRQQRNWFRNFEYQKEAYRGLDYREDAFSMGEVEVALAPGERAFLTFSLDEAMAQTDAGMLKEEEIARLNALRPQGRKGESFFADLVQAADQFVVYRQSSGGQTIIAGYHWFTDWGRDSMIAMRGLVIALGKQELAKSIIRTFLQYLDGGMLPNRFPDQGEQPEYNTIDATLWLFVVLHEYCEKFGDLAFIETVFPQLRQAIEAHIQGTRFNIHALPEGLLFGGEGIAQLTWMDARVGDYVVTPRHGCPVEINALWYNALMIFNRFAGLIGKTESRHDELAAQVKASFRKYFLNEQGYLNDVVIPGEYADDSIRPNQIYALSLPFPLLGKKAGGKVLRIVREQLLTPLGLRSLAPGHPDFAPVYGGDQWHRDSAYHQGTAWAYLLGEYWLAHLKINGFSAEARAEVQKMMGPLRRHFYEEGCIHGIAEIFDGAEPGETRGCIQQAWSVGMALKVLADMEAEKMAGKAGRQQMEQV